VSFNEFYHDLFILPRSQINVTLISGLLLLMFYEATDMVCLLNGDCSHV